MLNVNKIYPQNDSYLCESVFSDTQQANFLQTLTNSFELLIELCSKFPEQLKKIVYLAEDIIEISKTIPSSIRNNDVVDMRYQICDCIHDIASNASRLQMGLPIDIDKQICHICLFSKRYNT